MFSPILTMVNDTWHKPFMASEIYGDVDQTSNPLVHCQQLMVFSFKPLLLALCILFFALLYLYILQLFT